MTKFPKYGLAALCLLAACSRSASDAPAPNPSTNPSGTPMLSVVYELDTTAAHPYDTVGRYSFSWDAQGRISAWSRRLFNPATGAAGSNHNVSYFYNGNDTIVAREIYWYDGTGQTADTSDYIHAGGMLTDSIHGSFSQLQVFRFAISNGTVDWNQRILGTMAFNDRYHMSGTWPDNTSQLDTTVRTDVGGTHYRRTQMTTTYLSSVNPFYRVHVATPWPIAPGGMSPIDHRYGAPLHLIATRATEVNTWGAGGSSAYSSQTTYRYSFRPDGYPSRITEVTTGGINPGHRTLVLLYR